MSVHSFWCSPSIWIFYSEAGIPKAVWCCLLWPRRRCCQPLCMSSWKRFLKWLECQSWDAHLLDCLCTRVRLLSHHSIDTVGRMSQNSRASDPSWQCAGEPYLMQVRPSENHQRKCVLFFKAEKNCAEIREHRTALHFLYYQICSWWAAVEKLLMAFIAIPQRL